MSASSLTAVIDGASVPYTATLQNPGATLSNIFVMASVVQGPTRRSAGATLVNCGAGPATLELRIQNGLTTVLHTMAVPVTLTIP